MAYDPNEQFAENAGLGSQLRVWPRTIQPKTFAGGTGTIAKLTPVGFNEATGFWEVWGAGTEVSVLTANATPATDGTFTLTVNGITVTAIDHDVSAAALKAAIVGAGICDAGDITVVEADGGLDAASGTLTITWGGSLKNKPLTVAANFSGLTGNAHTLTESTAGSSVGEIRGLLWPDTHTLVSGKETIANVLIEGKVHYGDIVLPAGEAEADLKAALQSGAREKGLIIQGLASVR
mgnify:CR=1 FL=1